MTPRPISIKATPRLAKVPQVGGGAARPPAIPSVNKLKIEPIGKGGFAVHHFGSGLTPGISSPRKFVFSGSDKMLQHVRKTATKMKPQSNARRLGHALG